MRFVLAASLFALTALVVDCSAGGGGTSTQLSAAPGLVASSPSPSVQCTLPGGTTQVALAFPVPGASPGPAASPLVAQTAPPVPIPTNAAGGTDVVVAAASAPLPATWYTYLVGTVPSTIFPHGALFTTLVAPYPSGLVDPHFVNETLQVSAKALYPAGNSWVVYVATDTCFPGIVVGAFGS